MQIISSNTNEKLFLGPPIFFLDSYANDSNSKDELKRLINFTKTLNSIELIRKCSYKYKEIKDIFEEEIHEEKDGNKTITVTTTYKITEFTDYNGNKSYSKREKYSEIKNEKEKELPKLDEKKFTDNVKDLIESGIHLYKGMQMTDELEKKYNLNLSKWERFGLDMLGSFISQNK